MMDVSDYQAEGVNTMTKQTNFTQLAIEHAQYRSNVNDLALNAHALYTSIVELLVHNATPLILMILFTILFGVFLWLK